MFPELFDTRSFREAIDRSADWVVTNWGATIEAAFSPLLRGLVLLEQGLLWLPWYVLIGAVCGISFLITRNVKLPLGVGILLFLIGAVGFWDDCVRTIALMLAATLVSLAIGIPFGIAMSLSLTVRTIMRPLLDIMQTMPSFVYLIPAVMLLGPGKVPALLATVIYAVAPVMRLTDLGIRQVDPDVVEAVTSFGAGDWQKLIHAQLPLALPTIMAGINQTMMMALSMVVIASMIGAGGLGYQVLQGIGRLEVSRGLLAGLSIVALAIVFDRIAQAYGRRMQTSLHMNDE
ncbi:ABC transporter permease [Mesorhizobium retamae]|uniref:Proline/glycine betaine ABC transporter permease n=1 Tax=Mesorhizobium retamae TaxID=2912854 RepID=A0ABS9QDA4_9HYPH|nr:proline/glycine betaine ABC transporter permease [Mesorhizobium sp. IRAMC:0171]MCG7505404.1 proline/glycine betaine ABC transporter permease [Mesorhizobium sp. IRAMC:0171]